MADAAALIPTPRYEMIIQMAEQEARQRGHRYVGVEHLVLAVLLEGKSVPAQVLRGMSELSPFLDALERTMASRSYGPPQADSP